MIEIIIRFMGLNLIYSGLLFAVALPVSVLLKKQKPIWRYGIWSLVMLRLLLPPDLNAPSSVRAVLDKADLFSNLWGTALTESESAGNMDARFLAAGEVQTGNSAGLDFQQPDTWVLTLAFFWVCGATLMLCLLLFGRRKFTLILKNAQPLADSQVVEYVNKWRQLVRVSRPVSVVVSSGYLTPFTSGVLKPAIFIPKTLLTHASQRTIETVIAHEIAHIKRLDALWLVLQNIVQLLYYFNPLVWFANSEINAAREQLCDNFVLTTGEISSECYAQGLLDVVNLKLVGIPAYQPGLAFGSRKNQIRERITTITGGKKMSRKSRIMNLVALLSIGVFVLPMAKSQPGVWQKGGVSESGQTQKKNKMPFVLPIKAGRISSSFGLQVDPFSKKEVHHNGVDIAAKGGTQVYAAAAGQVLKAVTEYKLNRGRGRYIQIEHANGFVTVYNHLSVVKIQEGEQVKAGQIIGLVGSTGRSTGAHLHFEVMNDGANEDPAKRVDFSGFGK